MTREQWGELDEIQKTFYLSVDISVYTRALAALASMTTKK